jgi:uncharacterized protein (TIGR03066 family)
MSRPSGGMSRPSAPISRSPSMSRPSAPSRPAGGGAASRPSTRPSTPNLTPGSRPGSVDFARPSTGLTPGSRPSVGTLPSTRPGTGNIGTGTRPGGGNVGIGTRPGGGTGISQLPATRPGTGAGNRLPGGSTALLPGMGNRPGLDGNRPSQLPNRGTPGERRDNLQNQLSQRGDQARENLQNNRDQIKEDWQNRYDDFYDRHEDWHHGCWNGNAGDWWHHMWDEHTALMAFGTTMWGINRAAYAFGYWGYSNPYYTEPYPVGGGYSVDYSQPIAVDQAATAPATIATTDNPAAPTPGMADFNAARDAFYKKDYAGALASTNKALTAMPNDPIIHEFRALVLFAQGKYREAAAGLYSVLSVGPGWDWTTLISLYADQETYTAQLRKLEDYVRSNPKANDAKFVLAYHYTTTNNKDAAIAAYKALYKANPDDNLVKQLLLMSGGPEALGAPTTPEKPAPAVAAIPPEDLIGKWSASSQNNKFSLELMKDGNFVWSFTQGTQTQSVKGVYALDGNTLAMEPESGGTMLAEITAPKSGTFDFQMLGAPPGDPGLKFAKAK